MDKRIAVNTDDLRVRPKEALKRAAEIGFHGVEITAVRGDLDPRNLSASGRRHLSHYAGSLGLTVEAIVADFPGLRFTDAQSVDERTERTAGVIDLARDLNVRIVTAAAGALTHPETGEPSPIALQALRQIGEHADSRGVWFALRPSYDDADATARVLAALGCPALRVGLDPAAMVMSGTNPMRLVERFANDIAAVHVRDGTVGRADRPGQEAPLGQGDVDFLGLLAVLSATDFRGPYVLRRTRSAYPVADLQYARDTLMEMLRPV